MNERDASKDTENGKDPARIERDIDRTRASLGRTVDALERRLSPGELLDQALGLAREHGGEFATNLGRSVRNNPMPVILTGVGLAWMMASSNEPRAPARRSAGAGYQEWTSESAADTTAGTAGRLKSGVSSAKSAVGSMSDKAARAKDSVKQSVGSLTDSASETMSGSGDRVRMQSRRMKQGFESLMEDQPLMVGAIGLAIGAALGAALPRTESENRFLGETRDSAMRGVKEKAAEAYEDVKDTAADVLASTRKKTERTEGEERRAEAPAQPGAGKLSNGLQGRESREAERQQGSPDI